MNWKKRKNKWEKEFAELTKRREAAIFAGEQIDDLNGSIGAMKLEKLSDVEMSPTMKKYYDGTRLTLHASLVGGGALTIYKLSKRKK